jgi:hypothetical protein
MNERHEQLMAQAWIEFAPDAKAVTKRFAELIVRECAELTLDHKNDNYYNGWLDYRDEIRRHFGVGE